MTELVTNYEEYEAFVQAHPKGHFCQSRLWAKQKPDWDWQAVVSRDEAGRIRGSMAILFRKLPMLPITMAYGCRGPVCDPEDPVTAKELLLTAAQLARMRKAAVLRIDPDIPGDCCAFANLADSLGFEKKSGENRDQVQPQHVFRLLLEGETEASLLQKFHPKTRYNIRLAGRKGVEVRICGEEWIPAFSALMEETGERDGFVTRPAAYFSALLRNLGPHARLYLAFYEEVPIAGAIAVRYGDKTWYLYGASSNRHRNKMPNYLLQWEMIRWALETGCRLYDFRGVSGGYGENAPMDGLCRFKAGFGGTPVTFLEERELVLRPIAHRILRTALTIHGRKRS